MDLEKFSDLENFSMKKKDIFASEFLISMGSSGAFFMNKIMPPVSLYERPGAFFIKIKKKYHFIIFSLDIYLCPRSLFIRGVGGFFFANKLETAQRDRFCLKTSRCTSRQYKIAVTAVKNLSLLRAPRLCVCYPSIL